jgi:hypothetical protein
LYQVLFTAMAVAFGAGIGRASSEEVAFEFFAAYMLEVSLSAENLFAIYMIFRYFKVPVQHQEHVLWYVPTSHPTRFHNLAHETAGDGYPRTSWCKPPIRSRYGASMATPRGKSHHGQVFLAAERSSEALVPSRDSSAGAARSRRGRGWGAGVW